MSCKEKSRDYDEYKKESAINDLKNYQSNEKMKLKRLKRHIILQIASEYLKLYKNKDYIKGLVKVYQRFSNTQKDTDKEVKRRIDNL